MKQIELKYSCPDEITIVSNRFLDKYMPQANGEFVKVYLCLLKVACSRSGDFSLSVIADRLNCTDNDVIRALKYWEKAGIMKLSCDADGNINAASMLPLTGCSGDQVQHESGSAKTEEELSELLFIAEKYIGRPLNELEMSKIAFFYEELNFPADMVEYLIEYSVGQGVKNISYMNAIAMNWYQESIDTLKKAKMQTHAYNQRYQRIMTAMGLQGKIPIKKQIEYMDKWLDKFSFSDVIIMEACSRTVMNTGKPSFEYADSILCGWHEKGVRCMKDVDELDIKHEERARDKSRPRDKRTPNRFNNFTQRTYDYKELERELLESQGAI